jgi:hypothetical protein
MPDTDVPPVIAADAALDPWSRTLRELALTIADGMAMVPASSHGPRHPVARNQDDAD